MLLRVVGGKGGFGSNLRSMGARAATKETTNFEACRDLEGRRLRTVHDEQKYVQSFALSGIHGLHEFSELPCIMKEPNRILSIQRA